MLGANSLFRHESSLLNRSRKKKDWSRGVGGRARVGKLNDGGQLCWFLKCFASN